MQKNIHATRAAALAARDAAIQRAHDTYAARIRRIAEMEAKSDAPVSRLAERPAKAERAWQLRQQGLDFRKIGDQIGVSGKSAMHLVRDHEFALKHNLPVDLSTRARNALWNAGFDLTDLAAIAQAGQAGLLKRCYSLGKQSLIEISLWLKKHGHELT